MAIGGLGPPSPLGEGRCRGCKERRRRAVGQRRGPRVWEDQRCSEHGEILGGHAPRGTNVISCPCYVVKRYSLCTNVTECYFQLSSVVFSGILLGQTFLIVFSGSRNLSLIPNQSSLGFFFL